MPEVWARTGYRPRMDAATRWDRIEESELEVAGVSSGTGFGRSVGLRIRVLRDLQRAGVDPEASEEPRRRTDRLRRGQAWGPDTAKVMKEWVAVSEVASERWPGLAAEARTFVGSG